MKKKIVFMGTPDFAVPILEMLIENYGVDLVITQPDKFVGRKKVLTAPPVKKLAEKYSIKVLQPEKLFCDDDTYNELIKISPDIIITAAYGQLVSQKILDIPKYKCINVHGSLLPKLRGGAPIQYSLLEDFKTTGITIMYMEKALDAGDMISKSEIEILEKDNYKTLHDKLSKLGTELLNETLPKIFSGNINPQKQNELEVTYARNITREDEKIIWNQTARNIFNKTRALDPTPGAFTTINKQILKIWKSEVAMLEINLDNYQYGEIIKQDKDALYVKCHNSIIKILELQISGKTRTTTKNFLSNNKNYVGIILGE